MAVHTNNIIWGQHEAMPLPKRLERQNVLESCPARPSGRLQVLDALGVAHSGSGTIAEAAAPAFVIKGGFKVRGRMA